MIGPALDGSELRAAMATAYRSVVRLEARPLYDVGGPEGERLEAWRHNRPRPERSVRTDPYLARVAAAVARGVEWERLRVVDDPMTDYQRFQLIGYGESQACGDRVQLAPRAAVTEDDVKDAWLFDHRRAIMMHYRQDGSFERLTEVVEHDDLVALICVADTIRAAAVPLNEYLAGCGVARAS